MLEGPLSSLSIPLDQGNGYFFFLGLVFLKKKNNKDFLNQSFPKPEVISSTACPGFVHFVNV